MSRNYLADMKDRVMQARNVGLRITWLILMVMISCSNQSQNSSAENSFQEIIQTHLQRYPKMQIEDVYKLVHQAAMGNIHLGADSTMLKNYLVQEMAKIEASEEEPLVEAISPEGLVRVNLRPYKARGGDPRLLLAAMMQTAQAFTPDKEKIIGYWKTVKELADKDSLPFEAEAMKTFRKQMEERGFPAIHHSQEYANAYRPAYRVILKQYLPQIKQKNGQL